MSTDDDIVYRIGDLVFMPPGTSLGRIVAIIDDERVLVRFDLGDGVFDDIPFPVNAIWHADEELEDEDEDA
jgi:hypothetical protein